MDTNSFLSFRTPSPRGRMWMSHCQRGLSTRISLPAKLKDREGATKQRTATQEQQSRTKRGVPLASALRRRTPKSSLANSQRDSITSNKRAIRWCLCCRHAEASLINALILRNFCGRSIVYTFSSLFALTRPCHKAHMDRSGTNSTLSHHGRTAASGRYRSRAQREYST
jgi:hypothetical protein